MTDCGLWWGTVAHAVVSWGGHLLPWNDRLWIVMGDSRTCCGQLRRSSPTLKWPTVGCDGDQWHFVVRWGHLLHWNDWPCIVMGDSGTSCGQLRRSSPACNDWLRLWRGTAELSVFSWGQFIPARVIQITANCSPLHCHSTVEIHLPLKTAPRLCDGTLWQCKSQNWGQ